MLRADTHEFDALAARLRGADRRLKAELRKGMTTAVAPIRGEVAESARSTLPGGLGDWAAAARITTRTVLSGNRAGVTIKAARRNRSGKPGGLARLNDGTVYHFAWGRGKPIRQAVPAGYFTAVMQTKVARRARKAALAAMSTAASQRT